MESGTALPLDATLARWIASVRARACIEDDATARRTLVAVFESLGETLANDEVSAIEPFLPQELAAALRWGGSREHALGDLDVLLDGVELRLTIDRLRAREQVSATCDVLSESLTSEVRDRLLVRLPSALAELFVPRRASAHLHRAAHAFREEPPPVDTLASGRSGSRHPLSDARPERAHTHSVARNADPHGETKISSATGYTQERLHESMADGVPGPRRTVARTNGR